MHTASPYSPAPDSRRAKDVIDRVVTDTPRLRSRAVDCRERASKNARGRLLFLHWLGNHDGGQIGLQLYCLKLRLLTTDSPIGVPLLPQRASYHIERFKDRRRCWTGGILMGE